MRTSPSRITLAVVVSRRGARGARARGVVRGGPARWDMLELSLGDNLTTFDPALIKDVSGGRLAALLYPNLVKYGDDESLTGDAAATLGSLPRRAHLHVSPERGAAVRRRVGADRPRRRGVFRTDALARSGVAARMGTAADKGRRRSTRGARRRIEGVECDRRRDASA